MLWRERLHAVENEEELHGQRLLAPERAVVVEGGDAFRHRHKVRRAFLGHLLDEGDDGLLRLAVVPRGKRVGGAGDGGDESYRGNKHDGEVVWSACELHSSRLMANERFASLVKSRAGHPAGPRVSQAGC